MPRTMECPNCGKTIDHFNYVERGYTDSIDFDCGRNPDGSEMLCPECLEEINPDDAQE